MTLDQFFASIQPGITLYGVLLTFALICFGIGRYFWQYDKELVTESIDRLRTLMAGFRRRHIEPILVAELSATLNGAYEVAIAGLLADLYPKSTLPTEGSERKLIDDSRLKELVTESALHARLAELKADNRAVNDFSSSASGAKLFDELDHAYDRMAALSRRYRLARRACGHVAYAFIGLALILLIGIVRIVNRWPEPVMYLFVALVVEILAYGVYSFIQLEVHRRRLLTMWEDMELYGTV